MKIETVRDKVATALVDVICVGITIKKGQRVAVRLDYSKEWAHGGFRTIVGSNLGYTNPEAYYEAFSSGC